MLIVFQSSFFHCLIPEDLQRNREKFVDFGRRFGILGSVPPPVPHPLDPQIWYEWICDTTHFSRRISTIPTYGSHFLESFQNCRWKQTSLPAHFRSYFIQYWVRTWVQHVRTNRRTMVFRHLRRSRLPGVPWWFKVSNHLLRVVSSDDMANCGCVLRSTLERSRWHSSRMSLCKGDVPGS